MEGDILGAATAAVDKAAAEDTGNRKAKDIAQLYENLHQRYTQDAFANYTAGDFVKAAAGFEAALHTYSNPVVNKVDSMSTYYSGIFESMAGNNEKAKGYYQKAIDLGYYSEGNAFSGISNIYLSEGDTTKGTEILEQGFMMGGESVLGIVFPLSLRNCPKLEIDCHKILLFYQNAITLLTI